MLNSISKYSNPWFYFLNIKIKIHCRIAKKFATYSPQRNASGLTQSYANISHFIFQNIVKEQFKPLVPLTCKNKQTSILCTGNRNPGKSAIFFKL